MIELQINGERRQVPVEPSMPLLWVLRDVLGLTGTKFGCGAGLCGACTVHIDAVAQRSCQVTVGDAQGKVVVTIEGLSTDGKLHPVQAAWEQVQVPQCGFCQPGMIMAVTALLRTSPNPSDAEIDARVDNICRCGTYNRIRQAIHLAARITGGNGNG